MVTDIPYSFSAHAMDIFKNHLNINSLRKKIREARFVVTVSNYNQIYLSKIGGGEIGNIVRGGEIGNIVRIYNGIKLNHFAPDGSAGRPTFTFLCVARLVEKKGHRILIEACNILRNKGLSFECRLVGKGKLRSPIHRFIKEKKLGDYVKLFQTFRTALSE
jgi:glycosyltransferase involved in cell wall biosynthesis